MDSVLKKEIWLCDPPPGLVPQRLTLRDLKEVQLLAESSFSKRWSEADYQYFLIDLSARSIGLFLNCNLVAYALILVAQGDLDLISIATKSEHRRQGLAVWLLSAMYKLSDVERFFLEVDETNEPAFALYKKSGFEPYGRRKKYYEGKRDAILMRRVRPGA